MKKLVSLIGHQGKKLPYRPFSTNLHSYFRSSRLNAIVMATKLAKNLAFASPRAEYSTSLVARRSYTTSPKSTLLQSSRATPRASFSKAKLQSSFRRSYADTISPVTKRRGRGFFIWTWRLTYLSVIGGTAYLAYNIYTLRTPQEQFDPDPSKKTLVILGMDNCQGSMALLTQTRLWLGLRFPLEEA